ncbi:MAG: excisionase family DNA-binding protein [Mycobacterium kyogaense]|uniref:excisionase family DNA-binding protein n=1 Tax=Mycobacterium kyogaense TaxID=2212479 RepID=UPI002FF6B045
MAKTPRAEAHTLSRTFNRDERRQPRRYATLAQAAEYLGVTDRTIRQMIADGRLTGYRSGGRLVRIDLNELDDAMVPFGGGAA